MRDKKNKPIVGITMGDPAGIGPEIIGKTLARQDIKHSAHFCIIGHRPTYQRLGFPIPKNCTFFDLPHDQRSPFRPGKPTRQSALAALSYLEKAVALLKNKSITCLVTAPVCKEAISALGKKFHGHTEFLADAFHIQDYDMMFVCEALKTVVVTRHIPLRDVPEALDRQKITQTILLTQQALQNFFHIKKPSLAVCGLNPHAGEGGAIGREEITTILPAIEAAQRKHVAVQGPFPADTIFSPDIARQFDAIITMYHDQGTIPVKTLAFDRLVNFTIGLPFIRTSPAHGTAFAIAGKNKASASSMIAAVKLAARLVSFKPLRSSS